MRIKHALETQVICGHGKATIEPSAAARPMWGEVGSGRNRAQENRVRKIPAVVAMLLAVVGFAGCEGDFTQAELEQVVDNVVTANAEVDTCRLDMGLDATIEIVGGPDPGTAEMTGLGSGAVDSAARQMYMAMDLTIQAADRGPLTIAVEYYMVDGWMYTGVDVPDEEKQWIKMEMPAGMWDEQSQVEQQVSLLETAEEVNYLGMEQVDGVDCYVVEVVPDMEVLAETFSQYQAGQMPDIDLGELDLGKLIKETSTTQWVAADSYLFMKTQNHMLMKLEPSTVGAPADAFDSISEDITVTMTFSDYGELVEIDVPPEALTG